MDLNDLIQLLYHKECIQELISTQENEDGILFISKWEVPGVPEPSIQELFDREPEAILLKNEKVTIEEFNKNNDYVLKQLRDLDFRTIRALREGNSDKISELEIQAQELRLQLIPLK